MIQKREMKKKVLLFLCFIIFFHINPLIPSSLVVLGNEIVSEEGGNDPEETGNDEVIILEVVGQQDPNSIILSPESGSSFNEMIEVSGVVTEGVDVTETITLIVFKGGEETPYKEYREIEIKDVDGTWLYDLNIAETEAGQEGVYIFNEGTYTLQSTVTGSEEFPSDVVEFIVERTAPEIVITSPSIFTNKAIIEGQTESNLTVELFLIVDGVRQPTGETTSNDEGDFVFELADIVDGEYTVIVTTVDAVGNIGETDEIMFTYDGTRPFVSTEYLSPKPNMTQVPLEGLKVTAKIVDGNIELAAILIEKPFQVLKQGTETPISGTYSLEDGVIIFTSGQFEPNTKYFVLVNPTLQDKAGNLIHSRNWSFTTETNTNVGSPHGGYLNNTMTCKVCHGAHASPQANIQQDNLEYTDDPNKELEGKGTPDPDAINGYCMACHDGTVASNMNNHQSNNSKHNGQLIRKDDGRIVSQSCGNCHNVHVESHPSNPNLLKDHFVFDHIGVDEAAGVGLIDSSERLCESCHEYDSGDVLSIEQYKVFTYRNHNTSLDDLSGSNHFGDTDDYSLCLRCHNNDYATDYQGVNKEIADIEKFYDSSKTNSGHFILNAEVMDGSLLDGHMPCADCHDTHSSSNGKLIKKELGHNSEINSELNNWPNADLSTADNQRTLCLSCHNNQTELYGITVPLPEKKADGTIIGAHGATSTTACSNCHGGTSKTFIEAVHAPSKRGN